MLRNAATGALVSSPCFVCACWRCKTKSRRKETKLRQKYIKGRLTEQRSNEDGLLKTKLFTKKELMSVTDNFNDDRIIGKGGQGIVYKGMLIDGQVIAVKKSISFDESKWKEFINEVVIFSHINHRNVVRLLGCCLKTKVPLLVYEFISSGTLSENLHNSTEEFQLTWELRLRIASEAAGAIAYLHSGSSTPIYHRDIKSSNILLDEKYRAKVSDFGISRTVEINQTHLTTCVRGTFGYLDPGYFWSSQFSEKSDVYSFGVVLVELITGRKPTETTTSDDGTSVVSQFISVTNYSSLYKVPDPMIVETSVREDVLIVVNIAKRCLNSKGIDRPTMMEVAMVLERLRQKSSA